MAAGNKSPRTISCYTGVAELLADYLAAIGMDGGPAIITREHIEAFMADQVARNSPACGHVHSEVEGGSGGL